MKVIYRDFCFGLKIWPILRGVFVFAVVVSFVEILAFAMLHQFANTIPEVKRLNLIIWQWQLPFSISRMWDILALPLFVFFSYKNESRRENRSFDDYGNELYGIMVMDMTQISLCISMLGCAIFGIIYAVPTFIATYILWIIIAAVLFCTEGISQLLAVKRNRIKIN